MKKRKLISIILTMILAFGLFACAGSKAPSSSTDRQSAEAEPAPEVTTEAPEQQSEAAADTAAEQPEEAPEADVDSELPVRIMVLNGTTGFGMAKLMDDAANGTASLNYDFSVETDASNVTAALISGSVDIAALPTNAAAVVYNKTEGGVQLAALNTLGVLYVVANSESSNITSLQDLDGMTVYAPAQNPSILFSALCDAAGVNVTVDNSYAQPADLRTALVAGEVDIAVLPEPMVTIAESANEALVTALDLTAEWDSVYPAGSLVQGCVVVRREFAEAHSDEVTRFLQEYEASVDLLMTNPEQAGVLIEQTGVFTNGKVAQKAIPNCNICFLTGEEMRSAMEQFLSILFDIAPTSVGGAVPADDFYFLH